VHAVAAGGHAATAVDGADFEPWTPDFDADGGDFEPWTPDFDADGGDHNFGRVSDAFFGWHRATETERRRNWFCVFSRVASGGSVCLSVLSVSLFSSFLSSCVV
jgi:hypothetical protein